MDRFARHALITASFALLALTGCGSTPPREIGPAVAKRDLDSYLVGQVGPQRIPGLLAMVVDAKQTLYVGAFGQQDVAGHKPMRPDTIFRIASMTKPVTAVAALMLVDEGKLAWDAPVAKYLPEYGTRPVMENFDPADKSYTTRPARTVMTVRHLAAHTSGLGYPFSNTTLAALAAGTNTPPANYPLLHDPGTRWAYSEATRVLGRVVEIVSGQPLDQFLKSRLFDPLGMNDTSFVTTADRVARVATIHRKVDGKLVENVNTPDAQGAIASPVQGDGGLNSIGANHSGKVRVETQPAAIPAVSEAFPPGAGRDTFGLAVQVTGKPGDPGMRLPGSMSWAGIFNTEFWIDPKAGLGGILLMQYLPFYDANAISTLQGFERRVYRDLR